MDLQRQIKYKGMTDGELGTQQADLQVVILSIILIDFT